MSDKSKKMAVTAGGIQESAARAMLSRDSKSSRLLAASGSLGNTEMQKRIDGKNASRDQLLAFLVQRLNVMRTAQTRELAASMPHEMRKAFPMLADREHTELKAPDPTKWHLPAAIYEQAAYHLSRGELGRGAHLVDEAMREEKRCFENVSPHIDVSDLDGDARASAPQQAMDAKPAETCGTCEVPQAVDIAADIQAVETRPAELPNKRRVVDPRDKEDDEEEEENKGKGDNGKKDA